MINIEFGRISTATLQIVGNKAVGDGISFAVETTDLSQVEAYLKELIASSFKFEHLKRFDYIESLDLNPVYNFAKKVFMNNDSIIKQSNNFARHLYEQSIHPNIKSGELYVVLFKGCLLNGQVLDALGLFKTERKDTVLAVNNDGRVITVSPVHGTNLKKLDKGCIIFNTECENGYIVATVDNINNGNDAHYWTDNFLHVKPIADAYHDTDNVVQLCKSFIRDEMKRKEDYSISDAVSIACKSIQLLQDEQSFTMTDFAEKIFDEEGLRKAFESYKDKYQKKKGVVIPDKIIVSKDAIRGKLSRMVNMIRLDQNFEIKVHKGENLMERGYDSEKGLFFYRFWFEKEK